MISSFNKELAKDIFATASLLIKFGQDQILNDQKLFVAFLTEAGFTTQTGLPLQKGMFRKIMGMVKNDASVYAECMREFDAGMRHINILLSQHDDSRTDGNTFTSANVPQKAWL